MMIGAWAMASGSSLASFGDASHVLRPANLSRLAAVTAFGVGCRTVRVYQTHPLMLPAFIVAVYGLFWIITFASGATVESARADGWLFANSQSADAAGLGGLWTRLSPAAYNWAVLRDIIWPMMGLALISTFDMALNLPALQDVAEGALDFSDELRIAGEACMAGSLLGGGGISYLTLSPTRINQDSGGGSSRLSGVMSLIINIVCLLAGPAIVRVMPRFFVGGLLLYSGLQCARARCCRRRADGAARTWA
jgi:MFS superfamily sulfate permease-like transporter